MYVKEIEIPEGVSAEVSGNKVKISGEKGQLEKEFKGLYDIKIGKGEDKIRISSESKRRKIKARIGSIVAHLRNMIKGVTEGFTYKLKVIYSHFPVKITVEEDEVLIKNFLGEKVPRVAKRVEGVDVRVNGTDITLTGVDIEKVGLMASRLEECTRIKGRDRRRFLDGIYLVSRGD